MRVEWWRFEPEDDDRRAEDAADERDREADDAEMDAAQDAYEAQFGWGRNEL